jgi:hypothetical protein
MTEDHLFFTAWTAGYIEPGQHIRGRIFGFTAEFQIHPAVRGAYAHARHRVHHHAPSGKAS